MSVSFKSNDISLENSTEKIGKDEKLSNESKNPYLNKDCIPEIIKIDKNKIIFANKEEFEIREYLEKINNISNDLLDDDEHNNCENCNNDNNKFFCFNCKKNICKKCSDKCNFDKHCLQKLEETILKENINKIKEILKNYIMPINENEKIIKDINEYINKYVNKNLDNDNIEDIKNLINKDFSLANNEEKDADIFLIYQFISKDYINYFHFRNIEKILSYINKEYNIDYNHKYNGYGKIIYENGEYYIGQFKNSLRNGKGILYYKNERLMHFAEFVDGNFEGPGDIVYQNYDYYIGEWKDDLRHGKGKLCYKNGRKYVGDWVNDKVLGKGYAYYEHGEYYAGEWKNGVKHGKGIKYYQNGNIQYEGNFFNHKYNGKGILYDSLGNIMHKGNFINDKPLLSSFNK